MAGAEVSHANCGHCGAPLPLSHGVVVCQYCRRENRISVQRPAPIPVQAKPASRAALVWWVLGTLLTASVGIAFSLVRFLTETPETAGVSPKPTPAGDTTPNRAATPAGGPDLWFTYPPTVLIPATGSGAPLLVGVASWGVNALTGIDGATGKSLWHVPNVFGPRIYASGDRVLTFDGAKKLIRFDPRTGAEKWTSALRDEVYDITFGADCASLLRPGSTPLGIDLSSGQPAPCTPATPLRYPIERDKIADVNSVSGELTFVGSIQLDDKPVNPEPPRLAAQLSRGGRVLWKVAPAGLEPVWTSDGFCRSLLLTPAGVFVFGRNGTDHLARWVLLDLLTGRELYRQSGTVKVEDAIQLKSAGPLVFAAYEQRLQGYRVDTGAPLWSVGIAN